MTALYARTVDPNPTVGLYDLQQEGVNMDSGAVCGEGTFVYKYIRVHLMLGLKGEDVNYHITLDATPC